MKAELRFCLYLLCFPLGLHEDGLATAKPAKAGFPQFRGRFYSWELIQLRMPDAVKCLPIGMA